MGIDIYCNWRGQTEKEEEAQYTGFATDAGKVGYLREAYHGGPYVTRFLLQECWAGDSEQNIPAKVLEERLPKAVAISLFREQKIYGKKNSVKSNFNADNPEEIADLMIKLEDIREIMKDVSALEMAEKMDVETLKNVQNLIDGGMLPDYAQSFVDFVRLCRKKEDETGHPCTIRASY